MQHSGGAGQTADVPMVSLHTMTMVLFDVRAPDASKRGYEQVLNGGESGRPPWWFRSQRYESEARLRRAEGACGDESLLLPRSFAPALIVSSRYSQDRVVVPQWTGSLVHIVPPSIAVDVRLLRFETPKRLSASLDTGIRSRMPVPVLGRVQQLER